MSASILRRFIHIGLASALLCALEVSCTTLQVPAKAPVFQEQELTFASREGVNIRVRPIVAEDEYWQLFDDHLPKIGIAALWVEVRNLRENVVEMHPETWSLRIGNRNYPSMKVPEITEQYYAAHGIRMYAVRADRAARLELEKVTLSRTGLSPSEQCEGFLFFRIDPGIADRWSRAATLVAQDFRLSSGAKVTLEIALSHGTP